MSNARFFLVWKEVQYVLFFEGGTRAIRRQRAMYPWQQEPGTKTWGWKIREKATTTISVIMTRTTSREGSRWQSMSTSQTTASTPLQNHRMATTPKRAYQTQKVTFLLALVLVKTLRTTLNLWWMQNLVSKGYNPAENWELILIWNTRCASLETSRWTQTHGRAKTFADDSATSLSN